MKAKLIYIIMMMFLILPLVMAAEQIPIKTEISVNIENGILRIQGENLDWSKSLIDNETMLNISEKLEIIMIRNFGNISELSSLMETCRDNMNFSYKWEICLSTRLAMEINMIQNMVNRSSYETCISNMTEAKENYNSNIQSINTEKTTAITNLTKEKDDAESQKSWFILIAIVLAVVCVILANKSGMFRKGEIFKQRETPHDVRY